MQDRENPEGGNVNKTEEDPPTEVASWGQYLIGVINTVKKEKAARVGRGCSAQSPAGAAHPQQGLAMSRGSDAG